MDDTSKYTLKALPPEVDAAYRQRFAGLYQELQRIARRHGVTRAAVSKRCCELSELLDLRPSRAMRSLTARKRYRSARIRFTRSNEMPDPASK